MDLTVRGGKRNKRRKNGADGVGSVSFRIPWTYINTNEYSISCQLWKDFLGKGRLVTASSSPISSRNWMVVGGNFNR